MKVSYNPPIHLTYCLNVHPGESWDENFAAVREKALVVKKLVAPDRPFGLGLRLGARAADELTTRDGELRRFAEFLHDHNLYVFTINGFPYGTFHGAAVKQNAYAPDWQTAQRRDYTIRLADILAQLLPQGVSGSISTVGGSYAPWITTKSQVRQMAQMIADVGAHLHDLAERTGRKIALALEAEPDCFIETTRQAISFLAGEGACFGIDHLIRKYQLDAALAGFVWRRHIGVCLDTAHAAVEFEDPAAAIRQLQAAGVLIAKIQLSSALSAHPTAEALRQLSQFCDEVYLHQVKARLPGRDELVSYKDLPDALSAGPVDEAQEWRVHIHVPLFFQGQGELRSTSALLENLFAGLVRQGACEHLEIETYTFDVLPPQFRDRDVTQSVADEYDWAMRNILSWPA